MRVCFVLSTPSQRKCLVAVGHVGCTSLNDDGEAHGDARHATHRGEAATAVTAWQREAATAVTGRGRDSAAAIEVLRVNSVVHAVNSEAASVPWEFRVTPGVIPARCSAAATMSCTICDASDVRSVDLAGASAGVGPVGSRTHTPERCSTWVPKPPIESTIF